MQKVKATTVTGLVLECEADTFERALDALAKEAASRNDPIRRIDFSRGFYATSKHSGLTVKKILEVI
jgi:hypothetical protein